MRPSRVRAVHALVRSLGLDTALTIAHARPASFTEMNIFHRAAYLECLRRAPAICCSPFDEAALSFQKEFDVPVGTKVGDCPLFPEVWGLVESQAGASLACAEAILQGEATVAINWSGGLHHAAAAHASGFCFVNDIVLCIRRLLTRHQRVLYIDLDVHHGDGVEGAFYGNERVMTLSLHQFGEGFFPGTGDYSGSAPSGGGGGEDGDNYHYNSSSSASVGSNSFAVNAPLPARTGDAAYLLTFRTALTALVRCFDPQSIVLQLGADTIAGDLLGRLCVSTLAHTQCVADALSLGLPMVLLGGGGYHVFHTARCWAIHTATALGVDAARLPLYVPRNDPYYGDYRRECAPLRPTLHVMPDPAVDQPLGLAESLLYWRRFCGSLQRQMRAARVVRERFTRTVKAAATAWRAALLEQQQSSRRGSGLLTSARSNSNSSSSSDSDSDSGSGDSGRRKRPRRDERSPVAAPSAAVAAQKPQG